MLIGATAAYQSYGARSDQISKSALLSAEAPTERDADLFASADLA